MHIDHGLFLSPSCKYLPHPVSISSTWLTIFLLHSEHKLSNIRFKNSSFFSNCRLRSLISSSLVCTSLFFCESKAFSSAISDACCSTLSLRWCPICWKLRGYLNLKRRPSTLQHLQKDQWNNLWPKKPEAVHHQQVTYVSLLSTQYLFSSDNGVVISTTQPYRTN